VIPVVPSGAPVPVVPVVPADVPVAAAPPVPLAGSPIGDVVPGLPLLPATLPVPQDLVCEGTAWAEKRTSADPQNDAMSDAPRVRADRGDDW
jgi:hypothetical protein